MRRSAISFTITTPFRPKPSSRAQPRDLLHRQRTKPSSSLCVIARNEANRRFDEVNPDEPCPQWIKTPRMCRYLWGDFTLLRLTVLLDCFVVPPRNDVQSSSRFDTRNINANVEVPAYRREWRSMYSGQRRPVTLMIRKHFKPPRGTSIIGLHSRAAGTSLSHPLESFRT